MVVGRTGDINSIVCRVDEVLGWHATVVDQYGIFRRLRTDIRRGAGIKPREGETWVIDRTLGTWTFAARVDRIETPVISGSTDENPALVALLAALDLLGVIKNETYDTQLRAVHPHTHPHDHPHTHLVPEQSTTSAGDPAHTHGVPEIETDEDDTEQNPNPSYDDPDTDDDDPPTP